jgi:hypothetical protein
MLRFPATRISVVSPRNQKIAANFVRKIKFILAILSILSGVKRDVKIMFILSVK